MNRRERRVTRRICQRRGHLPKTFDIPGTDMQAIVCTRCEETIARKKASRGFADVSLEVDGDNPLR